MNKSVDEFTKPYITCHYGAEKVAVKKKIRKKVGSPAAPPSASPAASPAPKKEPKVKRPGEGFSVMSAIMLVVAVAMLGLIVALFLPRDISSDVAGYPYDSSKATGEPRNLLREAEALMIENKGEISFTEAEINTYLNQRLTVSQKGFFANFSKVEGIYMDFNKADQVTIYIERTVFGAPFLVDSTWKYFFSNDKIERECIQSRMGSVTINGSLWAPLMAPFQRFANACEREDKLLSDENVELVKLGVGKLSIKF